MIKINDNYTILGKDLNFVVECSNETKDFDSDDNDKSSNKKNKYFATLEGVCTFLAERENIEQCNMDSIKELSAKVVETCTSFKNIEVEKNRNVKIDIGGNWFIVGTYSCYRLLKKEYIKESRFTKEENIGKEKFITCGFAPNINLALKIILGESLLEFLSTEENNTFEDIQKHINVMVSDISNMTVEDTDDIEITNEDDEEIAE